VVSFFGGMGATQETKITRWWKTKNRETSGRRPIHEPIHRTLALTRGAFHGMARACP
jgi:hypothetical protein